MTDNAKPASAATVDSPLPWTCPDHPHAKIRHDWLRTTYVYRDGYPRGGRDHEHKYFCNDCGLELSPPNVGRQPS